MVANLIISAKLANLVLLKIKVFCNNGYDLIACAHDATKIIFSRDSNYIVDVVMTSQFLPMTSPI